jgi:nucleoid-associated protein YgaU
VAEQVDAEKVTIAVRNVEGVASVNNTLEVEVPKEEAKYHRVVSGDSLSKIAKAFYGNALKYLVIFRSK